MMTLAPPRPAPRHRPGTTRQRAANACQGCTRVGFLPARPRRPARHRDRARRGVPRLVRPRFRWCRCLPGAVGVLLRRTPAAHGDDARRVAVAGPGGHPPGSRLLPALVVVLAASAVLTILIQPETRWETFADQSLASLGYFQNWELANTASDYLRAGEAVSPLQHIWSMSVQGQFYIAFLALIFGSAVLFRRVLGRPDADRVHRAAERADHRVVRLRDLRPQRRSGDGLLQQLRAGVGAAARRPGRRAGAPPSLADVAAHDGRRGRAGRDPGVRRADRRGA